MVKDMDLTVSKRDPSEHLETEEDGHRVHALGGRLTIQPAQAWLYDQHAAAVRALEKGER